jgi:hypothetical protein
MSCIILLFINCSNLLNKIYMRSALVTIMLIAFYLALPFKIICQVSSTATTIGIDAKVIAPISISNAGSTHLNFGTISRSSVAGSVTISASGERSSSGGASVLTSSLFAAAPFSISGESSAGFNLTLPDNDDVLMTRTGGTEKMEVTNFTHNSGLVLSSSGTATFSVGATLNLDADQVAGEYTGTFSVTITYN